MKGPAPVVGMVERFSRTLVMGWVSVPASTPPLAVTLHVGKVRVAETYTNRTPLMSAPGASDLREPTTPPAVAEPAPRWLGAEIPSPEGNRRNSGQEIRTFSFRVRGIWRYVKRKHKVTVRVNGRRLPIQGHGLYLHPAEDGSRSLPRLRAKLRSGWVLTQMGRVELSKKLDVAWQNEVMGLYQDVRRVLADRFDHDLFFIGGTLLGAVREGGYIGHDADFDAAYLSRHTSGAATAEELVEIGLTLVELGYYVEAMNACLHVSRSPSARVHIDVFHTYFDSAGTFAFPWGVAGTSTVLEEEWRGTTEIDFPGGRGLVPANAEQMVEHLYGADWRLPKPGFNWHLERTAHAADGVLTPAHRAVVYWANQHTWAAAEPEPSDFRDWLAARPETPAFVVDLGCGSGRDAVAFAFGGRQVLALDLVHAAVHRTRSRAALAGVEDRVVVEVCDVADTDRLAKLVEAHRPDGETALFQLRCLVEQLPEEAQPALLASLVEVARPGDVVAVEFSQAADTGRPYVPGRSRPVAATELRRALEAAGFTVVREESQGGESTIRRLIARR